MIKMGYVVLSLFISLLLTELIELIVGIFFKMKGTYTVTVVLLVNLITNPVAVLIKVFAYAAMDESAALVPLIELGVLFTEALIYKLFSKEKRFTIEKPLLYALAANLASYLIGEILTRLV